MAITITDRTNEMRALNLARNTGVMLNGGLTVYRPTARMLSTSAPGTAVWCATKPRLPCSVTFLVPSLGTGGN
ncbi:hypothetical protein NZK33_08235 [Cyanobium sp. FGCU-6]|nr:hypothetical protein [Cyanobium sp. FGCU6]